ncbi:MAG TPA: Os1348 family NHLP clan protein [Chloroflexota bacterium]
MSYDGVQAVLNRALTDASFRRRLFETPDDALAEYDLTEEERQALRAIRPEGPDGVTEVLDPRYSKRFMFLWLD